MEGKVTERSFYPILKEVISSFGGTGVSEVSFNSVPDLVFALGGFDWILSVKIGDSVGIVKSAFLQYIRHKEESSIQFGILLLLPDNFRSIPADERALRAAVREKAATALIDAGDVKEELRDKAFPEIVRFIKEKVLAKLATDQRAYYDLKLVVSLLQQQVTEVMDQLVLSEERILKIVTNKRLLMNLGHLKHDQAESVGRFLASYILMSQILFLRLFYTSHPNLFTEAITPVTKHSLRRAFRTIEDINYKPIYAVDVLDVTPDEFVRDTFRLIWGLEIERAKHELPGRVFHELMPKGIRKMLAAFYTRPIAADLLAALCIHKSNTTVFDPASGSGTILVSAYRRKRKLFETEGKVGTPHKRFCEEEIYGADIMPFAVHLTEANLASLEVSTTIDRTQIMQSDSLQLVSGKPYPGGISQLDIFPHPSGSSPVANNAKGETYAVELRQVDAVLMNPPFTKIERGIGKLISMQRYHDRCGGEVGLWGHFIALAAELTKPGGIIGMVVPINILRGRESQKVRQIVFEDWTPLYIVKPTFNYAFSEWAEYRDILVIARKEKPNPKHRVKFCLVKKDLLKLTDTDVTMMAEQITDKRSLRSKSLDIDSQPLGEISKRSPNLMWYCGVTDFKHRDLMNEFLEKLPQAVKLTPQNLFREGIRMAPKGISQVVFVTRDCDPSRVQEAFLRFRTEDRQAVLAVGPLGAEFRIEKGSLVPSLRTPVGLKTMDVTDRHDYLANAPYGELERVCRATGFRPPPGFKWSAYWESLSTGHKAKSSRFVVTRRINPFSPATFLIGFLSRDPIFPSDQLKVAADGNPELCKSLCVLVNSVIFVSQFLMLKEESTGRYVDIRSSDLESIRLFPDKGYHGRLAKVYDRFSNREFPALRDQFDKFFEARYKEFWEREKVASGKARRWSIIDSEIQPARVRLDLDLAVCNALKMNVTEYHLRRVYAVIVKEMIMTRHLTKD